ncbi:MAG: hypothetical protein M3065_00520 [Actinomycetota bacterium]|nr:hypothetical protein [Actinomycetota bacterium]
MTSGREPDRPLVIDGAAPLPVLLAHALLDLTREAGLRGLRFHTIQLRSSLALTRDSRAPEPNPTDRVAAMATAGRALSHKALVGISSALGNAGLAVSPKRECSGRRPRGGLRPRASWDAA